MIESKAPLSVQEIPRFEFNLNDQELQSYLKEIAFNQAAQKKDIDKLKKEVEKRPGDSAVAQASSLAYTEIDIDSALLKQIKGGKDSKPTQESNVIRRAAKQFGKKLGTVSHCINSLHQMIKTLEKRVKIVEIEHPTETQNKTKYLQGRIEQVQQLLSLDVNNLTQLVQESSSENIENMKQTEKKTLWQIADCRKALETRITEQYVKDAMGELQQKVINRIKQQQLKLNFDPDKIIKMDGKVAKLQHQFGMHVIETQQHLKVVGDRMVNNLVNKNEYSQDRIKTEKRLTFMNNNVSEINKKMMFIDEDRNKVNLVVKDLNELSAQTQKEVGKMSQALSNMKLTGQFLEMLEKIDPHKICEMENSIDALKVENSRVMKEMEAVRKEIEKIRLKNTYMETLQPEQFAQAKVKKDEIEQIVSECLSTNAYLNKIQAIELKFVDIDSCRTQVVNLDKRVSKLSRQNDLHNLVYQLKGLEQFLKREVLMLQNRLTQFQTALNDRKSSRPTSATKVTFSHSNSSVNVKKLYPISCISHYQTAEFSAGDGFANDMQMRNGRASSNRKRKDN